MFKRLKKRIFLIKLIYTAIIIFAVIFNVFTGLHVFKIYAQEIDPIINQNLKLTYHANAPAGASVYDMPMTVWKMGGPGVSIYPETPKCIQDGKQYYFGGWAKSKEDADNGILSYNPGDAYNAPVNLAFRAENNGDRWAGYMPGWTPWNNTVDNLAKALDSNPETYWEGFAGNNEHPRFQIGLGSVKPVKSIAICFGTGIQFSFRHSRHLALDGYCCRTCTANILSCLNRNS